MAILIIIFDGAVPQPLAKDRLLHAVGVGSTGNAAIRDRVGFVSNENESGRALDDPIHAIGGAVPDGIRGVDGLEFSVLANRSNSARLALVCIWIDNVLLLIASDAGPQPVACLLTCPSRLAREAINLDGLLKRR